MEHINMTHLSKSVTIHGNFAIFVNSTLSFTSLQAEALSITIRNITIENSTVVLSNVAVEFTKCTLINVIITDTGYSGFKSSEIQIRVRHSTFKCDLSGHQYPQGIQLNSFPILKLDIFESSFLGCSVDAYVGNIMSYIVSSLFDGTTLQISDTSWLKVPSFIILNNTKFIQAELTPRVKGLTLTLHNPYIIIESCHFNNTPLHITPTRQGAKQILFYTHIFQSDFINGIREADGGAMFISSNIESSLVNLSGNMYEDNRAERSSTSGKGGAVYVEGQSLHLTVEDCRFLNNSASESGSAIFTTRGVEVVVINSSFKMDQTEATSQSMVTFFGKAVAFTGRFEIESKYQDTYSLGSNIFVIEELGENLSLSIHCPKWYRHYFEYQVDSLNSLIQTGDKSGQHVHNLIYQYQACAESYYTTSNQENIITYPANTFNTSSSDILEVPDAKKGCIPCPYGALCSGNNVIPRPNYSVEALCYLFCTSDPA